MNKDIFLLNNKIIVITGATGLLGRQHAEAVAAFGGTPVLLDLDIQVVQDLAIELNSKYDVDAIGFSVDITLENAIEQNCGKIIEKYGKIDALINNAANNPMVEKQGVDDFSRLENFPMKNWNADIAVGLTGAFLCSKYFGTAISKNPGGGIILNISSDLGLLAPDQRLYNNPDLSEHQQPVKPVTYSIIKTGLIGLTRYLATYWPDRVRCNAICPGGVDSGLPKEFIRKVTNLIPMGRMADPNEYQGVLVFLLGAASKYINGAVISVDGGRSCW